MIQIPSRCNKDVHALRVAYHEAGHAVVGWHHGFRVVQIDMKVPGVEVRPTTPQGDNVAHFAHGNPMPVSPGHWDLRRYTIHEEMRQSHLPAAEAYAQYLLAGNQALRRRHPHVTYMEALVRFGGDDFRRALNLAYTFNRDDDKAAREWLGVQDGLAESLLRTPALWAAVEALVPRLTPSARLTGAVVKRIIAKASKGGRRPSK